jgi:hypothetical protein
MRFGGITDNAHRAVRMFCRKEHCISKSIGSSLYVPILPHYISSVIIHNIHSWEKEESNKDMLQKVIIVYLYNLMYINVTNKYSEISIDFLEPEFVIDEACTVFTF